MTQTLVLEQLGVVPMTTQEEKENSGGVLWAVLAIVVTIGVSAINNFGDIREGLGDGFNGTPRYPRD
jgi:hypothetical protein